MAALVGTFPRAAFTSGVTPLEWHAPGRSLGRLMDTIEPPVSGLDRAGVGSPLRAHLAGLVADFASWPRATWTVQGVPHAGGGVAFRGRLAGADRRTCRLLPCDCWRCLPADGLKFGKTSGEQHSVAFSAHLTVGQLNRLIG